MLSQNPENPLQIGSPGLENPQNPENPQISKSELFLTRGGFSTRGGVFGLEF